MPLWQIFHPEGTFTTAESKQALAADITALYTGFGLPAFYVVVHFVEQPVRDTFVGGRNPTGRPFVRVVIAHIAVHQDGQAAQMRRTTAALDAVLRPHIADKGYDWEYHVDETPRGLWKINGIAPPPCK
ncbi:uncharacterized protein THITE_41800 [Thermothielavioides terrestris NRRL 8126]|jgi:phenylpyruvate tautomerase PptA (4-oxalocrotonate tautomerase family)|uniref:Tautomerase cis-CaaD-like domain-containing protein n=1 Tax=Thermothielavioides terrestris (strain ATCC 38088 / NRRL 8126) TaxID=578455 RepID=G2R9Q2_THETT|nr:uncharacterized protein THITE_41800 [Thermothielavioides terrestris NRRL 8126]AEO68740.1 hypothetical protein THITE_41800 [Thermothielavioides terrestris NRRL 8126]